VPALLRQKRHKGCITSSKSQLFFPLTLSRELLIFPLNPSFPTGRVIDLKSK
jgi:hypothetical protein